MPTVLRIEGNLQWTCRRATGGNWVAACDPLKLTLQAETWGQLMEDIAYTLEAMFKDLLSSHDLERFLEDRGWALIGTIPTRQEEVRFDVPFFPMMMGAHGSQGQLHQ